MGSRVVSLVPAVLAVAAPGRAVAAAGPALLSPAQDRQYQAAGTWSALFDPSSLSNRHPLVFWVAALLLIGAVGFPYAWLAARGLPDRGYSFARPVGLLLVGWLVWWAASLELVTFSRAAVLGAVVVVGAGAAAIAWRFGAELRCTLEARWRLLAVEEAAFWLLFGSVTLVRWLNPDLWHPSRGGEKPMDFAYLNAVLKSPHFPPFDPWFSGGYINYYYFGFVLVAVLVKLTAIVPAVAYNLAIGTLAAFLGTAAFGVAAALLRPARRARAWLSYALAGSLGLLFVTVVGNLGELRVLQHRLDGPIPLDWWYWNPSRAIGHPATEPGPINEFPAFTYLYADLHAHAMALPYTAVALGLAVAFVRGRPRRFAGRAARFALLTLTLGALWTTNTWDVPTYALVALGAILLGAWRSGPAHRAARLVTAGATWVALVGASYLAYLPFHRDYVSSFNGVERWRGSRTALGDYVTMHGFFLFTILAAALLDLLFGAGVGAPGRTVRLLLRRPRRAARAYRLHRALVRRPAGYAAACAGLAAGVLVSAALAVAGQGVPALVAGALTLIASVAARRPRARETLWQWALALAALALLLTLAVEFFVVAKIDVGRTNTVFKTYLQVWVLLGVAAAVSAVRLATWARPRRRVAALALRSAFAALFAVALLYPVLAVPARVDDRFDTTVGPTLDGMAFMRKAVFIDKDVKMPLADDLDAIRWMQENVSGSPVVAEVNTYPTLYGWGDRYAMFTGNPDIVGWDYHQRQQRPGATDEILRRIDEVQKAYGTRDARAAYDTFRRYGVRYVVVGPLERAYFPQGQAKWDGAVGSLWDLAYRNAGVAIFRLRGTEEGS
jgi:YYY domain-containing protein